MEDLLSGWMNLIITLATGLAGFLASSNILHTSYAQFWQISRFESCWLYCSKCRSTWSAMTVPSAIYKIKEVGHVGQLHVWWNDDETYLKKWNIFPSFVVLSQKSPSVLSCTSCSLTQLWKIQICTMIVHKWSVNPNVSKVLSSTCTCTSTPPSYIHFLVQVITQISQSSGSAHSVS